MPIKARNQAAKPPAKLRLSRAAIESLPQIGRDYLVTDTEISRLKLKVTPAGRKSFLLRYRNDAGQERKFKLGDYPELNVARARAIAAQRINDVLSGQDPAEVRASKRHGLTLTELFERFMDEYGQLHLRPSTLAGYEQVHKRYLAETLGKRTLGAITRRDVQDLHRKMSDTQYSANRTIGLIRRLYNWAIINGLWEHGKNPALAIKPYREQVVERLLSEGEHERLAQAIEDVRISHPSSEASLNAIVFLFFTGCRRGEAMKLRWADVDFERRRVAFIGAKSGDRIQPMSTSLYDWLLELYDRRASEFVFPGRTADRAVTDIKKTWSLVRSRAGLPELRLHDIRHNVLSDIAAATDLATAKDVGGHKSIQSTMRYIHARATDTQSALETSARRANQRLLNRKSDP